MQSRSHAFIFLSLLLVQYCTMAVIRATFAAIHSPHQNDVLAMHTPKEGKQHPCASKWVMFCNVILTYFDIFWHILTCFDMFWHWDILGCSRPAMLRASAFLPFLFAGPYSPPSSSCPHHWATPIRSFTHGSPLTVHALQDDEPGSFGIRHVIEPRFSETHRQWASVLLLSSLPSNIHQYFKCCCCIFITSSTWLCRWMWSSRWSCIQAWRSSQPSLWWCSRWSSMQAWRSSQPSLHCQSCLEILLLALWKLQDFFNQWARPFFKKQDPAQQAFKLCRSQFIVFQR